MKRSIGQRPFTSLLQNAIASPSALTLGTNVGKSATARGQPASRQTLRKAAEDRRCMVGSCTRITVLAAIAFSRKIRAVNSAFSPQFDDSVSSRIKLRLIL